MMYFFHVGWSDYDFPFPHTNIAEAIGYRSLDRGDWAERGI